MNIFDMKMDLNFFMNVKEAQHSKHSPEIDPTKFCVNLNKALPIRQDSSQGKI